MWSSKNFCNRSSKSSTFKFNRIFRFSNWGSFEKINIIIRLNVILFLLESSISFSAFWNPRSIIAKNICLESNSETRSYPESENFKNFENLIIIRFDEVFVFISSHPRSFFRFLTYFHSRFHSLARFFARFFIRVIFYLISLFR